MLIFKFNPYEVEFLDKTGEGRFFNVRVRLSALCFKTMPKIKCVENTYKDNALKLKFEVANNGANDKALKVGRNVCNLLNSTNWTQKIYNETHKVLQPFAEED